MTGIKSFFENAPAELHERVYEFRRMPKAKKQEAFKLAAAAAFIVCCAVAGYYAPDYF